jgi:hypothetical protein
MPRKGGGPPGRRDRGRQVAATQGSARAEHHRNTILPVPLSARAIRDLRTLAAELGQPLADVAELVTLLGLGIVRQRRRAAA